ADRRLCFIRLRVATRIAFVIFGTGRVIIVVLGNYQAVRPPSTGMAAPVNQEDSSDARKTARSAMSAGLPKRPSGIVARRSCFTFAPSGVLNSSLTRSVSTIEGQMQLGRIFSWP